MALYANSWSWDIDQPIPLDFTTAILWFYVFDTFYMFVPIEIEASSIISTKTVFSYMYSYLMQI